MKQGSVTTIDLLRHGAPEGGIRYRGSRDDPLSELGWQQMHAAVGEHHPWDIVISSPLRRCAAFAEVLCERYKLALEIEPGFREISFGAWEGRTPAEIEALSPEALHRFWIEPMNYPPPEGESLQDFAIRVTAVWQTALERHCGRHILAITHGGVIRMVLCHVLEIPLRHFWRLEVPYATFSRVRIHGDQDEQQSFLVFHGKGSE